MQMQTMHKLESYTRIDSIEETPSPGSADSTEELRKAFWEGYSMSTDEARAFVLECCGGEALKNIGMFIDIHRANAGVVDSPTWNHVLVCELASSFTKSDVKKIRGAMLRITEEEEVVVCSVSSKFFADKTMLSLSSDAETSAMLAEVLDGQGVRKFMSFYMAGYSPEVLDMRFRVPSGVSVETHLEDFRARIRLKLKEVQFSFNSEENADQETYPVRVSWCRAYSQTGLIGRARWRFVLHKVNIDMPTLQSHLERKLKLPRDSLHFAGLKDKRGLTYQFATLPATHSPAEIQFAIEDLCSTLKRGWAQVDNFEADNTSRKLQYGMLMGNFFRVRVRGVQKGASERLESLRKVGFINYFGLQRFGWALDGGSQHVRIGGAILCKDYKRAIRNWMKPPEGDDTVQAEVFRQWLLDGDSAKAVSALRHLSTENNRDLNWWIDALLIVGDDGEHWKYRQAVKRLPRSVIHLFPNAYTACLWNRLASRRIKTGGLTVQVGDLVAVGAGDNLEELALVQSEEEARKFALTDIRIPLLGMSTDRCPVREAGVDVQTLYRDLIEESVNLGEIGPWAREGIDFDLTPNVGCRVVIKTIARPLVVKPVALHSEEEWKLDWGENIKRNMLLDFYLPRGSYATMLLRELGVHQDLGQLGGGD
ncbi:tRNA pseudouridine synthase D, putative [Perkinsus marinus ATCC 50983]|uniref:tRNA pseudouridine synthase D, putative n=1 Tax=Perkinsus marinus (strain ATCC 50983 / TXsc) TaxID=423536 RepID=C5KGB8_PERM5|nr:tRNA pseudouridine synthase D, putative [Perkinsus marinus ATCC 50983]EER16474.1 tRNA pseudouridine synthase D, putative [Perkinsus marinus ATCC 50983]|eukprot:XP_002784678.1 tRNA pseudouridine synthase D, putative [Perkinsus marinus ATCC 50983]